MDVMNMLDGEALEGLRLDFLKGGEDGILMQEYVRVMMDKLLQSSKLPDELRDPDKLVPSLCDMFEEIDRNGNGRVEWNEFTGYCVDAGFVATRRFVEPLRFRYVEDIQYKDTMSRGAKINNLVFLPQIQRVASFERESMVLKLYDPSLTSFAELDVRKACRKFKTSMDARRKDMVVSCLLIPKKNILVVMSSDLSLTFWDSITLRFSYYAFSKSLQCCATYSAITGKMYTGGNDHKIQIWSPEHGLRQDFVQTRHREQITDLCAIDAYDLLVSCSLDKTIQLYDLSTHEWKATITGHTRGIKQLVYSEQQHILLSVGVETDAYGWDLISRKLVVRLQGHREPLIGIELLPATMVNKLERAVTADCTGNFRVWDFQRSHTGLAVCLQVFQRKPRSFNGKPKDKVKQQIIKSNMRWNVDDFHPTSFCVTHNSADVIAASSKMYRFTTTQCANMDNLPNGALYNECTMTFLTITGSDVQIWDGRTGTVLEDMFNVAVAELTMVQLDDRQRKFILGTSDGYVNVHSFLNGVRMKVSERSHDADVTDIAYVGREKIVISVARDRTIHIHDDWPEEECAPFLRRVTGAHSADLTCVDYSDAYSLIATGSADARVHLWSFEFLKQVLVIRGHEADLVAVRFVGDLPLLVSADTAGIVRFTFIGAGTSQGSCLHVWENWNELSRFGEDIYRSGEEAERVRASLTCMVVHKLPGTDRWVLCCGDEMGVVKCVEFTNVIHEFGLRSRPRDRFPFNRTGYNARRRIQRDFSHSTGGTTSDERAAAAAQAALPPPTSRLDPASRAACKAEEPSTEVLAAIKAHRAAINSVQVVAQPFAVLTASLDRSVRVHALEKGCSPSLLGVLNMSDEERVAIASGEKDPNEWHFDVEPSRRKLERLKDARAKHVFDQLRKLEATEAAQNKDSRVEEDGKPRKAFRARLRTAVALMSKSAAPGQARPSVAEKQASIERAQLKSQLLSQLISNDKADPLRAVKTYCHLDKERYRHKDSIAATRSKHVDASASDFLRHQLGFGRNKNLRDRRKRRVEALDEFRRRFAPGGYLGSVIVPEKADKGPSGNQAESPGAEALRNEALGVPRPRTTPSNMDRAGNRPSTTLWDRWEKTNESFLNDVSSLLSPPNNASLRKAISLPQLSEGSRPRTADALHGQGKSTRGWRRRSLMLVNRMEQIIAAEDDEPEPEPILLADSQKWGRSERDSVANPSLSPAFRSPSNAMAQSFRVQSSSRKVLQVPETPKRRRQTLVKRQSEFAIRVRKEKQHQKSITMRNSGLLSNGPLRTTRSSVAGGAHPQGGVGAKGSNPETGDDWAEPATDDDAEEDPAEPVATVLGVRDGKYGKRFGPYPDHKVRQLYDLFKQFDPDESGSIDMQEFYNSPEFQNSNLAASLGSIFETLDEDDDNAIDFPEFLRAFCPLADPSDIKNMDAYIRELREEAKVQLEVEARDQTLHKDTLQEISALFKMLDTNKDGTVSISELLVLGQEHNFLDKSDVEKIVAQFAASSPNGATTGLLPEQFIELCREYFSYDSDSLVREVLSYNNNRYGGAEAGESRRRGAAS